MTPFMELPTVCMPFYCLAFLIATIASLSCVSISVIYRVPVRDTGLCVVLLIFCLMPTVALTEGCTALYDGMLPSRLIAWLLRIPAMPFALIAILLLAANVRTYLRLKRWRKEHISRMSIKESVDLLPMGLCFCYGGNIPRLVNLRMNALSHALTGSALNDADVFWQTLTAGALQPDCKRISGDECPMIELADGTVWTFEQKWIELDGIPVRQLTATDTSEEYRLAEQLRKENRRLSDMKKRLSRYGDTVREVTREREILNAKVRIHDELGQALIATRRVLSTQVPRDELEAVAALWERSVSVLNRGLAPENTAGEYTSLTDAARAIGISIRWCGERPREGTSAARILQCMTHECLTNAVRHAGSTKLYVSAAQARKQWTFVCTNDGDVPQGPVSESGGLCGLRSRVEQAGGEMQITHIPRFTLTITIPEEGEA